ncbi:MAG: hypothetical protein AAGL69_14995 [Pseudomonadota bacterium]
MKHWTDLGILLAITALLPAPLPADEADVLNVRVTCDDDRVCRFRVTVEHDDQGWDHYANRWEVLTLDGEVLATRVLAHPHDDEQPFERSLGGVRVPDNVEQVIVRAHDSVHEYGGAEMTVDIPQ